MVVAETSTARPGAAVRQLAALDDPGVLIEEELTAAKRKLLG